MLMAYKINKNAIIDGSNISLDALTKVPICVGSQVIYPEVVGSGTTGKVALIGAYEYTLFEQFEYYITLPAGYHFEYRLTFQSTNGGSGGVKCYINNIETSTVQTWSGDTFRVVGSSRLFKKSDINWETTYNYGNRGCNLYYQSSTTYNWHIWNITIHCYIVRD